MSTEQTPLIRYTGLLPMPDGTQQCIHFYRAEEVDRRLYGGEVTDEPDMTNEAFALKLAYKLQNAISLLIIHGIISDSERYKARKRLDKWAAENGLKRKGSQT